MADWLTGESQALAHRGLTADTCKKFGYQVGVSAKGTPVEIANYRTGGALVAQKVRSPDKRFRIIGESREMELFGQHLWGPKGTRVIVTEGEIDAMCVSQAFGNRWAVVSLPHGADGAAAAIKKNLEWLEGYDKVVLGFDTDEPGRKASAECAPLFSPGKCSIAEWAGAKDAGELMATPAAITGAVWEARGYRPDGIVSLKDIRSRVLAKREHGMPWFLPSLTQATFGRYWGDLIALGAGTGIGKSDFITQQIAFDIMELGLTVGVVALEQDCGDTGKRLAGKIAGRRFHIPDGSWDQRELEETWEKIEATGRCHLYDNFGVANWEVIKGRIRFMVVSLGCNVIFLDHLTALAAAEVNELKALDIIMSEMAALAKELKFIFMFVSHLATPEHGSHEQGAQVAIRHFRGSRSIGFWSATMLGMERNQQSSNQAEARQSNLRCLKDRLGGQATGLCIPLDYDVSTGRISEGVARGSAQMGGDETNDY